jgi:hypothetical protein
MVEERQKGQECNNEIHEQGTRSQLCLRKEMTSGRIFRKNVELETEK